MGVGGRSVRAEAGGVLPARAAGGAGTGRRGVTAGRRAAGVEVSPVTRARTCVRQRALGKDCRRARTSACARGSAVTLVRRPLVT